MSDYPATLPLPDATGYGGQLKYGLATTQVDVAQGEQMKTFNAPSHTFSLQFRMTQGTLLEWVLWAEDNAWDWFNMPLVNAREPTDIVSTQQVRFISDIATRKEGHDWMQVSVEVEMMPEVINA